MKHDKQKEKLIRKLEEEERKRKETEEMMGMRKPVYERRNGAIRSK